MSKLWTLTAPQIIILIWGVNWGFLVPFSASFFFVFTSWTIQGSWMIFLNLLMAGFELWFRKQPLNQLCYNHCPNEFIVEDYFTLGSWYLPRCNVHKATRASKSAAISTTVRWPKKFLNGPTPASFSFNFGLFKQTTQILQQINVKNVMLI